VYLRCSCWYDVTLYVAGPGDIYLGGNITYAGSTLDHIPRLTVYAAKGNIIVSKDVTELHGVFVASGDVNASQGLFYSCGLSAAQPVGYTAQAASCNNPLTVYGAVVANKLILARTNGTSTAPVFDQYFSLPPVL
jgi:hypothetical protein